jgi:hypothetical protein
MTDTRAGAIAVFARNHLQYLEYAAAEAQADSERRVTFRSRKPWSAAKRAHDDVASGRIAVFFAVVGQPFVQFKATLQEVHLRPYADDPEAQRLIRLVPPETAAEGLWEEGHGTLYAISGCYRLDSSRPLSDFRKAADNAPLSLDFKYSYAIVYEPVCDRRDYPSPDTPAPPARVEASVTRIIRDTALACRLKVLYNDTCQICNTRLELTSGRGYSEGHHLCPLGAPHNGPDVGENIVIVCPNCHALLDRCSLRLEASRLTSHSQHTVDQVYLNYHNALSHRTLTQGAWPPNPAAPADQKASLPDR